MHLIKKKRKNKEKTSKEIIEATKEIGSERQTATKKASMKEENQLDLTQWKNK
jgi:hypothetical protein